MKMLILYRPKSEHSRMVEDFVREFQRRNRFDRLEMLNVDTREGSAMASLYDIVQYPAILALQNDGYPDKIWQGEQLPLLDEVASYATA